MKRSESGVSLIEVLVAIVIFSVGLLGLAAMQLHALQFNESASVRGHAVFLAYEMADRVRARPDNVALDDYVLTVCPPTDNACTDSTRKDHVDWLANLAAQLPGGTGSVAVNGDRVTVTVQWDDSRVNGAQDQIISIVTRI
ncbi:MAG: type IV pilus modification protein PilV [Hyphomonas sp.]|nr:type IV pilus modification protein PilV [Hyphomonas sp.]